jgi:hypothetical protein
VSKISKLRDALIDEVESKDAIEISSADPTYPIGDVVSADGARQRLDRALDDFFRAATKWRRHKLRIEAEHERQIKAGVIAPDTPPPEIPAPPRARDKGLDRRRKDAASSGEDERTSRPVDVALPRADAPARRGRRRYFPRARIDREGISRAHSR